MFQLCFELALYLYGMFLFVILAGSLKEYTEPLVMGGESFYMHTYISHKHEATINILFISGLLGYFLLKYNREALSPILTLLCIATMYITIAICILFLIQLMGIWSSATRDSDMLAAFMAALLPINYLANAITQIFYELYYNDLFEEEYENPILNSIDKFAANCRHKGILAFFLALPVLGLCIMILCLFGQQPDSIIKAFTETSDWLLSTKISPPPVEYEGHYLCTVSLRGHKKLVKPLRYGLRGGKRIVVNRQLCVANAFEELIAEKTPRFHRALRGFYDKYGYPISKHIKTALAADVVYLIMKPLEWIFIFTLYLFDKKPENRIARQYLSVDKQREFGRKI